MLQGTYTAALGIASHQQRLDTIANNLANVNTNGFRATRVDFKDAVYREMQRPHGNPQNLNMNKGHGVLVDTTRKDFTIGQYVDTGIDTNLFLEGQGYFMIQTPGGDRYFTRDGSFGPSVEADGNYLVTMNGDYVLNQNGERIRLEGNTLQVLDDGTFWEEGAMQPYDTIGVWRFANEAGLNAIGTNLFAVTQASGNPEAVPLGIGGDTSIIQKAVEGSNVNLGDEFASMVRAQRAMQLSSRALTMADEMDGTATQIRR